MVKNHLQFEKFLKIKRKMLISNFCCFLTYINALIKQTPKSLLFGQDPFYPEKHSQTLQLYCLIQGTFVKSLSVYNFWNWVYRHLLLLSWLFPIKWENYWLILLLKVLFQWLLNLSAFHCLPSRQEQGCFNVLFWCSDCKIRFWFRK